MNKQVFTIFLCLFFSISMCVTAQTYSGGSGTENDPYLISSKVDMEALANAVNKGNNYSQGKYFLLTQNLMNITTIIGVSGAYGNSELFQGSFDGGGHNINMNISDDMVVYAGVFGNISGATIKNLSTTGYISAWSPTSTYLFNYVGGICGFATNSTIINCNNAAQITSKGIQQTYPNYTYSYGGGICGYSNGSIITNCINIGNIYSSAQGYYQYYSGYSYAGGICGINSGEIINGMAANTYTDGQYVGRITYSGGTIDNCYALASMLLNGSTRSSQNANSQDGQDMSEDFFDNLFSIDYSTCSQSAITVRLYTYNTIKWQRSSNNEQSWTDIDCTSFFYTESCPEPGEYIYRSLNSDGTWSNYVKGTYYDAVPSNINTLPLTSASKRVDENVTFSLTLADNNYNYQWYKGSTAINDATSNTYSIPVLKIANAGIYTCKVWNGCNEIISSNTMLIVDKAFQTISLPETTMNKNCGDADFDLPKITDKNLTIAYTSSNTAVATVTGNKVRIVGFGTTTITASQAGNSEYIVATPVTLSLTVNKGQQTITFGELPGKTYGDASFSLSASVNSNLPVVFESSNTNVATISGNILTVQNAGTAYITASVAGNDNYFAASPVQQQLTVNKANQTVALDFISDKTYGDATFTLNAQVSSGLSIAYTSSEPAKLLISGNQATILEAGNITVIAQQAGNNNYLPASNSKSFTVIKANLTVSAESKERYYGDENPVLTYMFNGFVNGDSHTNLQTLPSIVCQAETTSPVGNYPITVSGAADNNYNFFYQNAQLTMNKASLTITAENKQREQGKENPPFTLLYSGFKNNENESILDILPSIYCAANINSSVGLYNIVLSGGSDNNYNYTLINGKLEVVAGTGIRDISVQLLIYPNPAKDYLFIQSDYPIEKIEIYNQSGMCILINDNVMEKLDVSGLTNGFYLARIYIDGIPVIKKIVIRK